MSEENPEDRAQDDTQLRGRFTRMLDREFIQGALRRKEQAETDEAELLAAEEQKRRQRRLEVARTITVRFHNKDRHLKERFPGMQTDRPSGEFSHCYRFPPHGEVSQEASLEFHCEVSHEGCAYHIHARTSLGGRTVADRLSFQEKRVDMARIDRFVERKILDFVRTYAG